MTYGIRRASGFLLAMVFGALAGCGGGGATEDGAADKGDALTDTSDAPDSVSVDASALDMALEANLDHADPVDNGGSDHPAADAGVDAPDDDAAADVPDAAADARDARATDADANGADGNEVGAGDVGTSDAPDAAADAELVCGPAMWPPKIANSSDCASCLGVLGNKSETVCSCLPESQRASCLALLDCESTAFFSCIFETPHGIGCLCTGTASDPPRCTSAGTCAAELEAVAGSTNHDEVIRQLNDPSSTVARVSEEGFSWGSLGQCAHHHCYFPR